MTTWTVPGVITRVVDGDTLIIDLDLGWGIWKLKQPVRILGINAPELPSVEGRAAAVWLRDFLGLPGPTVVPATVESTKLDKYGRVLAHVYTNSGLLSQEIVRAGHATIARAGEIPRGWESE